eukprot:gene15128-20365_t
MLVTVSKRKFITNAGFNYLLKIGQHISNQPLSHQYHHIAVVGSGPSGFYTIKYLFESIQDIKIDLFEQLPTPFGLVRYGVAPDHPEVKSVISGFHELVDQYKDRFRFFGNVKVTSNDDKIEEKISSTNSGPLCLSIDNLRQSYSATVLAYGASSDRKLNIPGENLNGVYSARDFVNWYNGHPYYSKILYDLSKINTIVILGQGNVALDCARILTKSPDELELTDIPKNVISALRNSAVEKVIIVGRRGHIQSAFTIKELRELTKIMNTKLVISEIDIKNGETDSSLKELDDNRPKKRIVELIKTIAKSNNDKDEQINNSQKSIEIKYLLNPLEILSEHEESDEVGSILFEKTTLEGQPFFQRAINSGENIIIPCDMILRSVGYCSEPLGTNIPFDTYNNTIPHKNGRVMDESSVVNGLYVTGWLKRGPTGIIGSNIGDAKETVASICQDINEHRLLNFLDNTNNFVDSLSTLEKSNIINWDQYLKIDIEEMRRGRIIHSDKIRVKIADYDDLLCIAKS